MSQSKKEGLLLKYFVLKPKGNNLYAKASREAMLRYAEIIKVVNPIFADDVIEWVKKEQNLVIDKIYGKEIIASEFKRYKRTNIAEMRPYIYGEDNKYISISGVDCPDHDMGMVARNPDNHKDQWYVARKYFKENFEEL